MSVIHVTLLVKNVRHTLNFVLIQSSRCVARDGHVTVNSRRVTLNCHMTVTCDTKFKAVVT